LRASFSQAAPEISRFLCVFRAISDAKWAQKGGLGRFRSEKVADLWMSCGRVVDYRAAFNIHWSLLCSLSR
jgi:hypothetical protein